MSSTSPLIPGTSAPIPGPAEPDPFSDTELAVWRGLLRVYETVVRELDRRLRAEHGLGFDAYGVLITLVTAPDGRLTIGDLGDRRNLSPSGVSRAVDRLAADGLVERTPNPADLRSFLVRLTGDGHTRLRASQVTHHAAVRELLLANLDERRLKQFAGLWETAVPGSVSSPAWPIAR
jgi:DNA-binding MarR family transcriptional regulator